MKDAQPILLPLLLVLATLGGLAYLKTLTPQSPLVPPVSPEVTISPTPTIDTANSVPVKLYYSNPSFAPNIIDCAQVYAVERQIDKNNLSPSSVLNELFGGPTSAEEGAGYRSVFSSDSATILKGVTVKNNVAYVNLVDIRYLLPSVSASCGGKEFVASVIETLKRSQSVSRVIFAINGDPKIFYDWTKTGCTTANDNCSKKNF